MAVPSRIPDEPLAPRSRMLPASLLFLSRLPTSVFPSFPFIRVASLRSRSRSPYLLFLSLSLLFPCHLLHHLSLFFLWISSSSSSSFNPHSPVPSLLPQLRRSSAGDLHGITEGRDARIPDKSLMMMVYWQETPSPGEKGIGRREERDKRGKRRKRERYTFEF